MTDDLPPVLPVLDTGTTVDVDGVRWPTAVIDVRGRPEIADLARVHATDGVGDVTTAAMRVPTEDGEALLLGVRLTVPVRCSFALAFLLPAHRQVLDDAAAQGQLVLASTDPGEAASERPLWLALDLDGEALVAALAG